jgi:outer membrane immunogenic protein
MLLALLSERSGGIFSIQESCSMRLKFAGLLIGAIGLLTAQGAFAADMPVKARPMAPAAYNWTGFYIGGNVGGGWGTTNIGYVANDPGSAAAFGSNGTPNVSSVKTSGVLGGIQVGYNWQFAPTWVAGLEADFDWSGLKNSGTTGNFFVTGAGPFAATAKERIEWFGTARARLGYLPMNNFLTFVTGGLAYGRVNQSTAYINNSGVNITFVGPPNLNCPPASTCLAGSSSTTAVGWTAGGGFEYAIAPKWTVKGEYLYVSLAGSAVTETQSASASSINANFGRTNFNVARVGVNYRY